YGHGVGLCVIGSTRLAERGVSAEAILARYFPGASLAPAAPRQTGVGHPSDPRVASGGVGHPSDPRVASGGVGHPSDPKPAASPAAAAAGVLLTLPDGDEGQRTAILQQT